MLEKQFTFEKKYEDISYKSNFDLGTLESDIYFILNKMGNRLGFNYETDIKKISEDLSLYDLKLGNYLLESNDEDYLNSLKENTESKGTKIIGEFEYKGKFYLILERPKINGDVEIELGYTNGKIRKIL